MVRDVSEYSGDVIYTCQRGNHHLSKVMAELHPISVTDVWKQIGIDLIGMLYMCMNNHMHRAPLGKRGNKGSEKKGNENRQTRIYTKKGLTLTYRLRLRKLLNQ